ncbi:MAG: riboflavin kinase [Rikenellaceae bacterium]
MVISGVVIHGCSLGRKLGFPTANIALDSQIQIENGVYACRLILNGEERRAISNIGTKPTVGGGVRSLECHILDFEGDLYGQCIDVEILDKLRDEVRFDSVEALRQQIGQDIDIVKNLK